MAKQLEKHPWWTSWLPCWVENIPNTILLEAGLPGRTGVLGNLDFQRLHGLLSSDREERLLCLRLFAGPCVLFLILLCGVFWPSSSATFNDLLSWSQYVLFPGKPRVK